MRQLKFDIPRPMRLPLLVLVLVIGNSVLFWASVERLREASESVRHTLTVQRNLIEVQAALVDAETGQRGYLITNDPRYLEPYHQASLRIEALVRQLSETVDDNPAQVTRIQRIGELSQAKLETLSEVIGLADPANRQRAFDEVASNDGRVLMEEVRTLVGAMEREEAMLLERRSLAYLVSTILTYLSAGVFVIGTVALLALLYWHMRRQVLERAAAAGEVAKYAASLDDSLADLQAERSEMAGIYEAGNFLQTCNTLEELGGMVPPLMRGLFPELAGELSLFAASRNQLVTLASWQNWTAAEKFAPDECWALRRGQAHLHAVTDMAPCCAHIHDGEGQNTLCVPLVAHGETIGLLTIGHLPNRSRENGRYEAVQRKAELIGRQIGLTLTNLRLRETLKEQSVRDPLTNVFNRRYLESIAEKELSHAARTGQPLAVVMLDIDHFKRFNDVHGHSAGDQALTGVAGYLQRTIREGDWMFRYGGEEFVLLLREASESDIACKVEELRAGVERLELRQDGQPLPGVTVSMGVTVVTGQRRDLIGVLADADAALYHAKRAGRNRVVFSGSLVPSKEAELTVVA